MEIENKKCVIILDEELPLGILANTSAVLGVTLGKEHPEIIGPTLADQSTMEHMGIVAIPIPILKGNKQLLQALRKRCYSDEFNDCTVVDFTDVAQSCIDYDDYIEKMKHVQESDLHYFGIGLCGEKKKINKLTGCLPLLR